jgi:DNA-3-methyladenine glycosylase II
MTEDSSRDAWLQQARSHLRNADPVLARLIDDRPDFDPGAWIAQLPPMDLFGALLFQVTGQQLSVPATRRTLARLEALFSGHLPAPAELLGVDPGKLRQAGLSWRKIDTLRDLAGRLSDGRLDPDVLSGLPDDELMAELTVIPGIGPWTVQGAMIVALGREDVVLPGDLALRKAVRAAYRLDHLPSQQEVLVIADKWRPYRSLATSYLFSAAFESAGAASDPVQVRSGPSKILFRTNRVLRTAVGRLPSPSEPAQPSVALWIAGIQDPQQRRDGVGDGIGGSPGQVVTGAPDEPQACIRQALC